MAECLLVLEVVSSLGPEVVYSLLQAVECLQDPEAVFSPAQEVAFSLVQAAASSKVQVVVRTKTTGPRENCSFKSFYVEICATSTSC